MLRQLLAAFSRYRPRALTVLLLAAIASAIVLANSSEEIRPRNVDQAKFRYPPPQSELRFDLREPIADTSTSYFYLLNVSYGWPLVWRQYVLGPSVGGGVLGENYSPGRLAGNAAIWLVVLVAPVGACEWLLRRYRPRWRFSLRTMLVVVALAAGLCGWFVAGRNRADRDDPLIEAINAHGGRVWVEHEGPQWLDLFGAERFRRRIVGAQLDSSYGNEEKFPKGQTPLEQLTRRPDLQYLSLDTYLLNSHRLRTLSELRKLETLRIGVSELTRDSGRALGGALSDMPRLRALTIATPRYGISREDEGISFECLAAIAAIDRLEHFRIEGRTIGSRDLEAIARMRNLRSLALVNVLSGFSQRDSAPLSLAGFPPAPRLETLDLTGARINRDDLHAIAALPNLRVLNLASTGVRGEQLAELAPLQFLEELAISGDAVWPGAFESLAKLPRLKRLHISGLVPNSLQTPDALRQQLWDLTDSEADDCLRALTALRTTRPELAIDGDFEACGWPSELMPPKCETIPSRLTGAAAREAVRVWKEKQAGN